jgi:hypothetical protein
MSSLWGSDAVNLDRKKILMEVKYTADEDDRHQDSMQFGLILSVRESSVSGTQVE